MELVLDVLSWACFVGGAVFCIIASIGILRFPDFYTRIHAAGITDTLGAALIILGMFLQAPAFAVGIKLVMIVVFLWITSPTSTHALAQSAHAHGIEPVLGDAPNPFKDKHRREEED